MVLRNHDRSWPIGIFFLETAPKSCAAGVLGVAYGSYSRGSFV